MESLKAAALDVTFAARDVVAARLTPRHVDRFTPQFGKYPLERAAIKKPAVIYTLLKFEILIADEGAQRAIAIEGATPACMLVLVDVKLFDGRYSCFGLWQKRWQVAQLPLAAHCPLRPTAHCAPLPSAAAAHCPSRAASPVRITPELAMIQASSRSQSASPAFRQPTRATAIANDQSPGACPPHTSAASPINLPSAVQHHNSLSVAPASFNQPRLTTFTDGMDLPRTAPRPPTTLAFHDIAVVLGMTQPAPFCFGQYSASVARVSTKMLPPMFHVWTATLSISGAPTHV
ncbi:hypothetical protein V8E36_008745 [Tilletia maclaganii]